MTGVNITADKPEKVINGLFHCIGSECIGDNYNECEYRRHGCIDALLKDAFAMLKAQSEELDRLKLCRHNCKIECLLEEYNKVVAERDALRKAQEPNEDWISRKRLRDEIQYYIDEAGWGDEVNNVLGWCLEFIDNQEAVKWE